MGAFFLMIFLGACLIATLILLIVVLVHKNKNIGIGLGIFWGAISLLFVIAYVLNWMNAKTVLEPEDYHGNYVIDRSYFSGEQSDWQYHHFRFKITEDDSIFFYVTENEEIIETYKGVVNYTSPYQSSRLIITMNKPTHHVVTSNPTTYRGSWSFFLVFESPKFSNMYFRKGEWEDLDN
jgi:hypothetical protein